MVIVLAHNADMTERALMGFAVIIPGPRVTDFTTGNRVARQAPLPFKLPFPEGELEGCLGGGRTCGLLVEPVKRAVGKKKGCLSESKESPQDARPISILLKTL